MINAALLMLLAAVTFAPDATAQVRSRGTYTMVAGGVNNNSQSSAVYVVDVVNQEMMVLTYISASRELKGLAYRDLKADAADLTRSRSRAGG